MGNFYLVDQSLKGLGGHHFDYTNLLTQAAITAEWPVVVGCHRKFQSLLETDNCHIRNCFRNTTYADCSSLVGIQDMVSRRKPLLRKPYLLARVMSFLGGNSKKLKNAGLEPGDKVSQKRLARLQAKRIKTFREDLHTFFSRPLTRDDVVFLTTLSDLEAEGLYQFIRERSDAKLANWHLQFHFPIFRGRTPEYEGQEQGTETLKRTLRKLKTLSQTNIRFYVTSDNLRDQYLRTGFEFEELPYPVNPKLVGEKRKGDEVPNELRLTFAGAIRDEKGGGAVEGLINAIEQQESLPIRFCVQKKRPKLLSRLKSLLSRADTKDSHAEHAHVETYPYPLGADEYHSYIKRSHIGLLTTYDSVTYFPRRAGILGEYLTAGVPVIVPAGSWLSDQIESEQKNYLRGILSNQRIDSVSPKSVVHQSAGKTVVGFDSASPSFDDSHARASLSILQFDVVEPRDHGNYFRVQLLDGKGNPVPGKYVILGNERTSVAGPALSPLPAPQPAPQPARQLAAFDLQQLEGDFQFEISPAYHSRSWQIENVKLSHVIADNPIPRGTIGLVAADIDQTVDLVREIATHYRHYRDTAAEFSTRWFARHDPNLTFKTLINHSDFSKVKTSQAA